MLINISAVFQGESEIDSFVIGFDETEDDQQEHIISEGLSPEKDYNFIVSKL